MDDALPRTLLQLNARAVRDGVALDAPRGLAELPWLLRLLLADVFAQIQAGEEAALRSIRRVVIQETLVEARRCALLQERDERRHVDFFAKAADHLGVRRFPMRELVDFLALATAPHALPGLLLANNLVVETLAHELFRDVAQVLLSLGEKHWLPAGWRQTFRALGKSLGVIFRDESRHVAFGVLRLRSLREQLSAQERAAFDSDAQEWEGRLSTALEKLPIFPLLRPWFRQRTKAILRQYRERCHDVGVRW
ncbi:MAG: hypothetical protein ACKVPX_15635 [Myxococcaceae bacterium]